MAKMKKHKLKFTREVQILKDITKEYGNGKTQAVGFTQLYHYEMTKECFLLVIERLGSSLKDIRDQVSKCFSLKNIIMIGIQMVGLDFALTAFTGEAIKNHTQFGLHPQRPKTREHYVGVRQKK